MPVAGRYHILLRYYSTHYYYYYYYYYYSLLLTTIVISSLSLFYRLPMSPTPVNGGRANDQAEAIQDLLDRYRGNPSAASAEDVADILALYHHYRDRRQGIRDRLHRIRDRLHGILDRITAVGAVVMVEWCFITLFIWTEASLLVVAGT